MKKILESGKLWTVLSAFIFVMTFSLVVYAATNLTTSSPYTSWKTSSTDKILDEDEWNTLMEKLQNQANNAIPAGAVMAFDLTNCPNGWSRYDKANNKFIMGLAYDGYLGQTGGNNIITLEKEQLPEHFHFVVYERQLAPNYVKGAGFQYARPDNQRARAINSYGDGTRSDNHNDSNERYSLEAINGNAHTIEANAGRSSSVGNGSDINITNAHIKLLYCIKN